MEREIDEYKERNIEKGPIVFMSLLLLTVVVAVLYVLSDEKDEPMGKTYTESEAAPSSLLDETSISGESIHLEASASEQVVVGLPFEVTFTLKNGSLDNIQLGDWDESFDVSAEPRISEGTGFSVENGKEVKNQYMSYIYVVVPKKEGTFTIAPAKTTVNGVEYASNALTVSVFPGSLADDKNFVATVSDNVVVGKQFKLTFSIDSPDADNFQVSDLSDDFEGMKSPAVSRSKSVSIVDGGNVVTGSTTYTYLLIPKRAGTFTIPSAKVTANGNSYESNPLTIYVSR